MAARANTTRKRRLSYPVQNLQVEIVALNTAIIRVRERARKEAVHRLRTATRKIESQFAVVSELEKQNPAFKAVNNQARPVQKLLASVRKTAGRVRDIDVQRQLTKDCVADEAAKELHRDAKELRGYLKRERVAAAEALMTLLEDSGPKLELRLETLLAKLKPMSAVGLFPVEQEVLARNWYKARVAEAGQKHKLQVRMHKIRKAAKLARYMSEPGLPARVVEEFEAIQKAGGLWHDFFELRGVARDRLGKRSGLTALLKVREASAQRLFETLVGSQRTRRG